MANRQQQTATPKVARKGGAQPAAKLPQKKPARGKVAKPATVAASSAKNKPIRLGKVPSMNQLERQPVIAPPSYYCAEEHSFNERNAMSDWLAAEEEKVDSMFNR